MKQADIIKIRKIRRIRRARKQISEHSERVRLSVFRSNKHFYAQIIDDVKDITLVAAGNKDTKDEKLTKMQKAEELGKILAKKALAKKIKNVVFDKGGYRYHGRVKAFADAARKEGLEF